MPHCVIEYASDAFSNEEIKLLVKKVHQGLLASSLFNASDIKTRAIACDYYQIGEQPEMKFVHFNIAIMPGRTPEQVNTLLSSVSTHVEAICSKVESLTMEVTDINKARYIKRVLS